MMLPFGALAEGSPAGNYLSGQFARANGDIEGAIRYLRAAYEEDPKNIEVSKQLQGLLLLNGDIEGAVELAGKLSTESEKNALSALLLVLHDLKQGRLEQASLILNGMLADNSDQLWLPLVAAWLDVSQKKLSKPVTIESLTVPVGRTAAMVNYHLALINDAAGFTDEAVQNFKSALEDMPQPPVRVLSMFKAFYEEQGQPSALIPLMTRFEVNFADSVFSNDALDIRTPHDGIAEVLYTMGNIMYNVGSAQDAVIYLQLTHYLRPQFDLATLALAGAYNDLRQYKKSNEIYAAIPASSSLYMRAQLSVAVNLDTMDKTDEALALLDKLSKQSKDAFEPLVAKGDLLRMKSQLSDAVNAYTQALKRLPELSEKHWPVLYARGACQERLGNWDAAEQDLRRALELKPNQPDVLNYLGFTLLTREKNIPEAREMVETALKARPNDPQIIDSMGWALYLLGRYDEAALHLEKAVALLPSDPIVNDHLGDVYWRLGRKQEAKFQWERALNYSPEENMVLAIQKKLQDGLPPVIISKDASTNAESSVALDHYSNATVAQ